MRAILYCRNENGTDNPEKYVFFKKEYPEAEIIKVCGETVASDEPKPVLDELLERAKRGEFDILVTRSLTLIGKNLKDMTDLIKEFHAAGIVIVFEAERTIVGTETLVNNQSVRFLEVITHLAEEERNEKARVRELYRRRIAEATLNPDTHIKELGYK